MGAQEVQQFLSHLAMAGRVAASTQSQALSAIVLLYQQVLKQDIGRMDEVVRAKQPHRVPVVLTQDEVTAVLRHLTGTTWIMATLLYGAGLRRMECIRLRVKDVEKVVEKMIPDSPFPAKKGGLSISDLIAVVGLGLEVVKLLR